MGGSTYTVRYISWMMSIANSPIPFLHPFSFVHIMNHTFYLLKNPPLMLMVRMFVHTLPSLVMNCRPPTPNFPPTLLS
jgi:hypothetical protein